MAGRYLICVLGPTAVGKTGLGISIAKSLETKIISADSRQFYKGMEIGTAAPSISEQKEIEHFFVGFRDPDEHLNAGEFEVLGLKQLEKLFSETGLALVVGGSGLFINAIIQGFDELPSADEKIRQELEIIFKNKGIRALNDMLSQKDPEYFEIVDQKNPRRLIRALEVIGITGVKYSELRKGRGSTPRDFNVIKIGLRLPSEDLARKINDRVEKMIKMGLVEEVGSLMKFKNEKALNSVGYSEIFDHLDGKMSLEEAIDKIKTNTRKFARRQMTWFKRDAEIQWFHPDQEQKILSVIKERIGN